MASKPLLLALLLLTLPLQADPWGKDADLAAPTPPPKHPSSSFTVGLALIDFHKNVTTHASGPRSHFRPSSSTYMAQAIQRYGLLQGGMMGCDRLMRENDDLWIYPTRPVDGIWWKYDPVP